MLYKMLHINFFFQAENSNCQKLEELCEISDCTNSKVKELCPNHCNEGILIFKLYLRSIYFFYFYRCFSPTFIMNLFYLTETTVAPTSVEPTTLAPQTTTGR